MRKEASSFKEIGSRDSAKDGLAWSQGEGWLVVSMAPRQGSRRLRRRR